MVDFNKKLKDCLLFYEIDENEIGDMLKCLCAYKKSYNKNEFVFSSGDAISEVGIVINGSVNVINEDFWGNRDIITKISPLETFAEAFSCTTNKKMLMSVVATEKTDILFINCNRIITVCSNSCVFHNRLIGNMLRLLAEKNIMLAKKINHMVKRSTKEKLLSYLSQEAMKANKNTFEITFNRQELADYLSVDRSAMSNELCKLRDSGVLDFDKNKFTLHKL